MLKRLENIADREFFHPTWIGLFINPYYIIRKGLNRAIRQNSHYLHGRMMDFGCGSKPYAELIHVEQYIGVDIEVSGHDHKNSKVDVYYDGKKLPFENEYFDSVFSSEVFEHVFNLDDVCQEINRVLKPQGTLLITIPFVWEEHEIPFDFARYTSFGIKHILEKNGFDVQLTVKTNTYVETIFQIWSAYLYANVLPGNVKIKKIFAIFLVAPVNMFGIFLSKILPKDDRFYNNQLVVAKKKTFIQ